MKSPLLWMCQVTLLLAAVGAEAAPRIALVPNQGSGTLSVIDTDSGIVLRTLPSAGKLGEKIQAVAVDVRGRQAFVVDAAANTLIQVDVLTGQVSRRLAVGAGPEGASMAPSGKLIAVCVEEENAVVLADPAGRLPLRRISTQGSNPEHCAFSPDSAWLMTSNENSNDVDIIDVRQGRSVARIATAGHPRGIAWSKDGKWAYVAQETAGSVDVIDVVGRVVAQNIKTGLRPAGAVLSRDGRRVFVSNGGDGTVSVVDTTSRAVLATIAVGKRPWNMDLTRDGRKLLVANGRSNSVSIIDTVTLRVIGEISVGMLPWGVTVP